MSAAAASPIAAPAAGAELLRGRFARFAWGTLAYTVFVVLFGAVVRITGSGAGCGQHWPGCQGEVAHLPRSIETAIELTHRLTSGLSIALVIALLALGFRRFPRGHLVRRAATLSLVFMIVEALIGAALVLLRLVGHNDSIARAVVMAAHLVNTSLLTATMAITAWSASRAPASLRLGASSWALALGLLGVLLVSVTGAVTALGDTLYPLEATRTLAERVSGTHFLERLRIVHPVVAVTVSGLLLWAAPRAASRCSRPEVTRLSRAVVGLVLLQLAAGVVNVLLSAPGFLQVIHLLLATLVWIALVLLTVSHQAAETRSL
jgi:heme A synthase